MKFKMIAAACAALCSVSAYAANLDPTTTAPDLTFYVGGASAQAQAVAVVAPDLFDTTTFSVVKITQSGGQKSTGWFGKSKAALTGGVSKNLLVVYNSTNGSAAGVTQLVSTGTAEAEADVVTVGTSACTPVVALASTCTSHAPTEISLALSDVYPTELVGGVVPQGVGYLPFSALTITKTGLEGFGVVVNPALYAALQSAQGLTVGSLTAANQPSINRADYASLVTVEGTIKDAGGFLQNGDTTPLTLVRRTDPSGTQAASNIFFANNVCGTLGFGGALTPVGAFDSNAGVFDITEQTGTGAVKTALTGTNTAGYALGVISLENASSTALTDWQFVKLDGVSPNFKTNGTLDAKNRDAVASGRYPFATEMTASYRTAAPTITKNLATAFITGLKDSTKHDLVGIAYLDGATPYTVGGKQARVNRGGNNCQPLIN